jgi:hypothetical protein
LAAPFSTAFLPTPLATCSPPFVSADFVALFFSPCFATLFEGFVDLPFAFFFLSVFFFFFRRHLQRRSRTSSAQGGSQYYW